MSYQQKLGISKKMKWYSVKKYRPPAQGFCLIRTQNGVFFTAEWRGGSSDCEGITQYNSGWCMDTLCEEFDAPPYIEIFGVTHFAIIDPIEIEE